MESQSRVGRWVDNANEHAREFGNPFVPTHVDPAEKSDFYSSSSHQRSRSSSTRPSTTRSFTVPESRDRPRGGSSHHHQPHRSGTSSSNTRPSSSSSGTSSSSSASTARPHNSRSYTVHTQHPAHGTRSPLPQPVRSRTMPTGYHYPQVKGNIVLPPIQPGQTYVIVPPHGRQVNVISPDRSHVVHRVMSPSPSYQSSSTKDQPLIKRLFGFGSPSGGSSRSGSHSSRRTGVETGGKPRRTHGRGSSY